MSSTSCHSADVLFIRPARALTPEQRELELATQFFGVNLKVITVGASHNNGVTIDETLQQSETLAVVIAANILTQVNEETLLRALSKRSGDRVPLLILGLTPEANPTLLQAWSGGAVIGCRRLKSSHELHYTIGRVGDLTGHLSGLKIPHPSKETFYLALDQPSKALEVIKVGDESQELPTLIEATVSGQRVFLDCSMRRTSQDAAEATEDNVVSAFTKIAPAIMFIKQCAGDRGWHALHHYANLTIDDPLLQEPYGLLDYDRLLTEMQEHDFHTTIAFIPWNYDRSESGVVSMIRNHPERFSISIHGDNHDHKEFGDYESKPLDVQLAAVRQSLARMDRFQTITGIPYDKVMVFPHSIAPEKTLEALKNNNYLATVNSRNIPIGSVRPPDSLFVMRSFTLSFGGFPSIIRYSAAAPIPNYLIAINEFLDNPLLFYCHHQFFEGGIDAFDDVADRVNILDPNTRWRGLGDIVRHLYLAKLRDDSDYDVLAFSASINLENTSGRDAVFYVRKMEVDRPNIASVLVDGQARPFELHDGYLEFNLAVPAGQDRDVTIRYKNPVPLPPIGIEKRSVGVYLLRRASEIRDNFLYKSSAGRALVHLYYNSSTEEELSGNRRAVYVVEWMLILMSFGVCVGWSIRLFIKRRLFR